MVFFIHIIIFDSEAGFAMSPGQTVAVTGNGVAALSRAPVEWVVG
jgi:Xaa-Pro dipeptidase